MAGSKAGGYDNFAEAQKAMTGLKPRVFNPDAKANGVYQQLYGLYRKLHDAFGTPQPTVNLYGVMKDLIEIRSRARR